MKYRTIVADPPWKYTNIVRHVCQKSSRRRAMKEYYYPTMGLEDQGLPVRQLSERDSVLFLWATTPMLQEAFEVMKAWGFRKYKTMLTWHKTDRDCMGYWFRTCTEHLIVGVQW